MIGSAASTSATFRSRAWQRRVGVAASGDRRSPNRHGCGGRHGGDRARARSRPPRGRDAAVRRRLGAEAASAGRRLARRPRGRVRRGAAAARPAPGRIRRRRSGPLRSRSGSRSTPPGWAPTAGARSSTCAAAARRSTSTCRACPRIGYGDSLLPRPLRRARALAAGQRGRPSARAAAARPRARHRLGRRPGRAVHRRGLRSRRR